MKNMLPRKNQQMETYRIGNVYDEIWYFRSSVKHKKSLKYTAQKMFSCRRNKTINKNWFLDFYEIEKILFSDGIYTARRNKTALLCTNFKLKPKRVLQQYRLIKCTVSSQKNGDPKTYRFPSLANIDTKMIFVVQVQEMKWIGL